MLDIEGRPHVDTGVDQFSDILIALGMTRAARIGVRQLIHDQQARLSRQRGVEVELAIGAAIVLAR
ncbi:hypothetical protein D3C87_2098160 [compost metagenome]